MPLFPRHLPFVRAYTSVLETLIPRLEEQLSRRLERLEGNVAKYELQRSQSRRSCATMREPQRRVDPDLGAGRPSVIVLGARLRSDQRYCRTLIGRAVAVATAGIGGRRAATEAA